MKKEEIEELKFKVITIGNSGVGKNCNYKKIYL